MDYRPITNRLPYQGTTIPADMVYLMEFGIITNREFLVMFALSAQSHCLHGGKLGWCALSNEEIGSLIHIKPRTLKGLLASLVEKGLVARRVVNGNERTLGISWRNVSREIEKLFAEMESGSTVEEVENSGVPNDGPRGVPDDGPGLASAGIIRASGTRRSVGVKNTPIHSLLLLRSTNKQKGHKKKTPAPSLFLELATELSEAIPLKRSRQPSMEKWTSELKRMCTSEELEQPTVAKVLRWYCKQFNRDNHPAHRKYLPKFMPQAISMSGFCKKYTSISDAMGRAIEDGSHEEELKLTPQEQKWHDKMLTDLKHVKKAELSSLPSLIQSLSVHLKKCRAALKETKQPEKTKELYLHSLFSQRIFFVAYAGWIESEIGFWKGTWGGDLRQFAPKGKHFARYIDHTLSRGQMFPAKEIRRILD